MSYRGLMPSAPPYHGQSQQQQQQQHPQQYQQQQQQPVSSQHPQYPYAVYPSPSQQPQSLQPSQQLPAPQYPGNGGYPNYYNAGMVGGSGGMGGGQPVAHHMQYAQQPSHQHQHQHHEQQRLASPAAVYGVAPDMNQFTGLEPSRYNPYMQQPAASHYMPPPNVWQQNNLPQQPQQQQQQQQQQQPQQVHQRMEQMRASPIQQFDHLPQASFHQQPSSSALQPSPTQQFNQQLPAHLHQQGTPSPRFQHSPVPPPQINHHGQSPIPERVPVPHQIQSHYRQSPTQPSPVSVPAPISKQLAQTTPRSRQPSQTSNQSPQIRHGPQLSKQSSHLSEPQHSPNQSVNQPATPQPEVQQPIAQPEAPAETQFSAQDTVQETFQFVNLQDIQQMPMPPLSTVDPGFIKTKELKIEPVAEPKPSLDHRAAPETITPASQKQRREPSEAVQIKASPHSSVAASPALSARSLSSISKKSPSVSSKTRPGQSAPMLIAVAEEFLEKARGAAHDVAMSLDPEQVEEYQKLISVSIGCLETVLHSGRLTPRQEAKLRLRYATVLHEETDNVMECETALTKGIALCDNHRLHDLKYCSQYLLLRVLFQRSRKAALKALDSHIADCETYKHMNWHYAFRLLKASLHMEAGSGIDASAVDNLRALQTTAARRGDVALSVYASLLEALTYLKAPKGGTAERVQSCLAHVAKYQLDPSVKIMQVEVLALLLDVAANLNSQTPEITADKLRQLQKKLSECEEWHNVKSEFAIPIRRSATSAKTVSSDTAAIIYEREGDESSEFLIVSFMTKVEFTALVYTIGGLANFQKSSSGNRKPLDFWREGLHILEGWDQSTAGTRYGSPVSLQIALRQRQARGQNQAYLNIVLGLMAASHCDWDQVQKCLTNLESLLDPMSQSTLTIFTSYLTGVLLQGTGDIAGALSIFQQNCFRLPTQASSTSPARCDLALLAGLSRLWIMQHPSCRRDEETLRLVEELEPLCSNHPNLNLRTAWSLVMASIVTNPPQQLHVRKRHMHGALQGSAATHNLLQSAITLCIMRNQLFEDIVGAQALKSGQAAAKQAQRSGNTLWQSVADGMLAHSYETQGAREEARREYQKGASMAAAAFSRSS